MKQQTWRHLAVHSTMVAAMALSFPTWAAVPTFSEAPAAKGDPNFCLDQSDGAYEHPDCRVRYSCRKGLAAEQRCPDGQVFDASKNPDDNPTLSYCSVPESVKHVDCSGIGLVK